MSSKATLGTILGAVVNLVTSWQPNDSIENDIQDGIMLLGTASNLGNTLSVSTALANDLTKSEAFLNDLNAGQIAIGPTVSIGGKKVASLYAFEDSPVLAQLMGTNVPPAGES